MKYFINPHQKLITFGTDIYEVKVPTTVWTDKNSQRSFLSPEHTHYWWNEKKYTNLNELRLDMIEARVIQKATMTTLLSGESEIGGIPWTFVGYNDKGGQVFTAPLRENCTGIMVGPKQLNDGDSCDLRVTKDGEYWIAPVGQEIKSMYGWRKIGMGQVVIPRSREHEVHFYQEDIKLKVRKIYEANETTTEVTGMKPSEALRSQMTNIAQMIAEAEEKEAQFERAMASEPVGDENTNAVIYWSENFGRETGPTYTYVAVKCGNLWYTTQKKPNKAGVYSWREMVDEFHAIRHLEFWTAAEWVRASE